MSCLIARTVALNLRGRYFLLHISKEKEFIGFFVKMKIEMSVKARVECIHNFFREMNLRHVLFYDP